MLEHWLAVQSSGTGPITAIGASGGPQRARVLEFLITSQWTIGEASRLGVPVSDAEARHQLARFRYAQIEGLRYERFPHEAQLKRALAGRGETAADQVWLMKLNMLAARIEQKRLAEAEHDVTTAQLASYYRAHEPRFVAPERRDFEILMTGSRSATLHARREIEAGKPFLSVARRVSNDPEAPHGLQHLTRYEEEPEFVAHVFAAKLYRLEGPIHQALNYYLFRLMKIEPVHLRPLGQARAAIRRLLGAARYRQIAARLAIEFEERWRADTSCMPGYAARGCG
jgi:hypothetical protein